MMKPTIYVTRKVPEPIYTKLSKSCHVNIWNEPDIPVPREVLLEEVKEIDGLYCLITETIDQEVIEAAPHLKVISNMAVGYNNIDVEAAAESGIIVANTPGVLTETTADLTFALLMATARRLVEANDYLKKGQWKTWSPLQMTGQDIYGSTLGIIGFGRIGQAVAKRASGFHMDVLYYNRTRKQEMEKTLGVRFTDMETLLKESDFICLLVPYNKHTHHLIGEKELKLMKSTAVLINTARGGVVDEQALYQALINEEIWGAGLDVFEREPVDPDLPLLMLPNVVALPHIGSASIATRMRMANLAADNLINALENKEPVMRVTL